MKITRSTASCRASVMVTGLLLATVVAIVLLSYLRLIANQSFSTRRSEVWNRGVAVMEAGVEEALTQIHAAGISNLFANNWTLGPDGDFHKTRSVGSDGSYCQVSIQPVDPPVIYSTAYMPAPLSSSNYVTRKVRVTTRKTNPVGGGLTARSTITFGGGSLLDSFNSCVGPYDPANPGTNAVALSNTNVAGAVNVSGGDIYGIAVTGPGGTVTASGNGAIGDTAWIASNTGIQSGHTANDANIQFNDVPVPYTTGLPPSGGYGGNGTNYAYVVNANINPKYYVAGKMNINAGQGMIVLGQATLFVDNDFTITGGGFIYIPPGSSLKLYLGGKFSVTGTGIVNAASNASALAILGLPTCTFIKYSGSASLVGTVNAPEATFSFSGGAGAFGSFSANIISVGGHAAVHYDECLSGPGSYVVAG